jgi:very-short-patch-repair endonuclease
MKKIPFAPRISPYRNQHQLAYARCMRRNPTPSEAALFGLLRNNALGFKVKRQVVIGPYVVDLLVASVGLVIEIDGSAHYGQEHNDALRQREIELLGFEVVRFSASAVMANPVGVAARIGEHVQRLRQVA